MTVTSITPYFIIITLLFLVAGLIVKFSSFYKEAIEKSSKSYYQTLDGLRGMLAVGVFFHHAVLNYYYYQTGYFGTGLSGFYDFLGQAAVALFFMITGFLFWSKALKGKLKISKAVLKEFYISRFLRIYPLYWVSLALVIIIITFTSEFSLKNSVSGLLYELIRLLTLLSVVFINGSHGPTSINSISIVPINSGVQWTLVYEVQFYLILPFLTFFLRPKRFTVLAGAALIVYALHPSRHMGIILNFLWGMMAAYLVPYIEKFQPKKYSFFISLVIVFLALVTILFFHSDYLANPASSFILFIMFTLIASGNTLFKLLIQPCLRYLGIVSYSIYLLHGIILFLTFRAANFIYPVKNNMDGLGFWLLTAISGFLIILFSGVTYRLIEYPFLSTKTPMIDFSKSG